MIRWRRSEKAKSDRAKHFAIRGLSRRVHDQRLCQGGGVLTQIEAVRCQPVEGGVGGGGMTADFKRIENVDCPEPPPGLARDPRVLALGVDDQHRAFRRQQVRDDGADAFPGPCRGEGDQVRRAVIAQEPPGVRIAPDQETAIFLPFAPLQLLQFLAVRKPGRAVAVTRQPEIGIGPGGHAPVLEPEDSAHKHEGTEDQPLRGAFAGRLVEESEDERGGHQRAEHRPEQHSADHPAQQDGRED